MTSAIAIQRVKEYAQSYSRTWPVHVHVHVHVHVLPHVKRYMYMYHMRFTCSLLTYCPNDPGNLGTATGADVGPKTLDQQPW